MLTHEEFAGMAEELSRRMEPHIRKIVRDALEESLCEVLDHLGHELHVFAQMKKAGDV